MVRSLAHRACFDKTLLTSKRLGRILSSKGMKGSAVVAVAASVFVTVSALAIPIQVDLGASGVVASNRIVSFPAPNVLFQGQNLALDFTFQDPQFIRLFTDTSSFLIDVLLRINSAPLSTALSGTGYLTDQHGAALGPPVALQTNPVTDQVNETGVDLVLTPPINNLARPIDVYDFHFDLTLPNSPTFGFGLDNDTSDAIIFGGNIFGAGPDIPADVIPETGETIALLALGLVVVGGARAALAGKRLAHI